MRCLALAAPLAVLASCAAPQVNYNYAALPDPTGKPYTVQAGDVIQLRVLRNATLTGSYTVRPDGFISVPLVAEVRVRGLTLARTRSRLVKLLTKYIEDAADVVSVALEQVHGVRYSVIGEVNRAGLFESPTYVTLLEALANAGGLTAYARRHAIYVLRAGDKPLRIPVSYHQTVNDSSGKRNFFLLSGDIVVVP